LKLPTSIMLLFVTTLVLATCVPAAGEITPGALVQPTTTATTSNPLHYVDPVDSLIKIIEASDPASLQYDPASAAYAEFPDTLKQLAALNSSGNNAASMLAYAMGFPRQDSTLAAQELISLGPDWTATELPALIGYLRDPRPRIRMYSAIVLSITGTNGSCSLGNIGPLLWDPDPFVRTSAAVAIQGITGKELIADAYAITPDNLSLNPVSADLPEGKIAGTARTWWTEHGSRVNWHPAYDLCDP